MSLPYVFDLLWDVKELSRLKQEYWWAKQKAEGIEYAAREHGIDLGEHPPWEYCKGCGERVELDYIQRCPDCRVCFSCESSAELDDVGRCADCARNAGMLASDDKMT